MPLSESEKVECPHCHALVSLPDAYRELRRVRRLEGEAATRLRALAERASVEPNAFLRWWALSGSTVAHVLKFLLLGFGVLVLSLARAFASKEALRFVMVAMALLIFAIGVFQRLAIGAASYFIGVDLVATFGALRASLGVGAVVALLVPVPAAINTWAETYGVLRLRLKVQLAAVAAPNTAGVFSCRRCGAALVTEPDSLGARCDYCGADNLIGVTTPALDRFARDVSAQRDSLEELLEDEERARAQASNQTSLWLLLAAALPFVFAFIEWFTAGVRRVG